MFFESNEHIQPDTPNTAGLCRLDCTAPA